MDDQIPEEKHYYQFHLTSISDGGILNESASSANVTMAASDLPYGLFGFSQELLQITEEEKWVCGIKILNFWNSFSLLFSQSNSSLDCILQYMGSCIADECCQVLENFPRKLVSAKMF